MSDKLDEIAERCWENLPVERLSAVGDIPRRQIRVIRAALDEAVAEERKALREIVQRELDEWGTAQSAGARIGVCKRILAALDARSKP